MRRASQRAQMMPQHVQHELGTQEQGPKTVREKKLAGMSGGADRQTDFLLFWIGSVSRQSRKGAQNGFLASIRRRRPRGGLADIRRGGTPPARRPRRRPRQPARAVKVRRRPRPPNSAAPACQLAATPPSLACWIRHHRPCWLGPCVPREFTSLTSSADSRLAGTEHALR